MSVASFSIDQAGLAGGTTDRGRRDGLATGALVTLNHEGGAFTLASFRILSCPSADTTARASLARTAYNPGGGVCTYTFSPTALAYGSYLIEEIVDGKRKRLVLAVLTPNLGLEIPAWNAQADPSASMAGEDGASAVAASNQNAVTSRYPAGDPRGDFWALEQMMLLLDAQAGSGSVLWEWDGTLDQFDGTDAYSPPGAPASSLTLVADATQPKGQLLRYEADHPSATPVGSQSVRLVTLPLPEGSYSLRFELVIAAMVADPNTGACYPGIAFFADLDGGGDLYTHTVYCGTSGWGLRIENGVDQYDSSQSGWANPVPTTQPGILIFDVRGNKTIGDPPVFTFHMHGANRGVAAVNPAYGERARWERGAIGAPAAGWDDLTCLRFGIALAQAAAGLDTVSSVDIVSFRVLAL